MAWFTYTEKVSQLLMAYALIGQMMCLFSWCVLTDLANTATPLKDRGSKLLPLRTKKVCFVFCFEFRLDSFTCCLIGKVLCGPPPSFQVIVIFGDAAAPLLCNTGFYWGAGVSTAHTLAHERWAAISDYPMPNFPNVMSTEEACFYLSVSLLLCFKDHHLSSHLNR